MDFKAKIREIPDWPKPGILFYDITPLLEDAECFKAVNDQMARPFFGQKIDKVVAIDARGFLLAPGVAYQLKAGVSLVRKKGKLPHKTVAQEYDLEYGANCIEMHEDTIKPGEKVLIVDDVLATGGTAQAAVELVKKLGGEVVGVSFLIELELLKGRGKLTGLDVFSLIKY
ncbi:MAG: adenine phosphoribosyltransferase [bacterium]